MRDFEPHGKEKKVSRSDYGNEKEFQQVLIYLIDRRMDSLSNEQ
jgi:hypothetical protein